LLDSDRNILQRRNYEKRKDLIRGMTFALFSGASYTGSNFIIKRFKADASDVTLIRFVLQTVLLGSVLGFRKERFLPRRQSDKFLSIIQGFCGALSVVSGIAYVNFMPVADGLTLVFCNPAATILLSSIFLGRRLTLLRIFSAGILVIGAVFVCQPPVMFGSQSQNVSEDDHSGAYLIGVVIATSSCLFGGLTNVLIAKAEGIHMSVLVFWVSVCGLIVSIIYSLVSPGGHILSETIVSLTPSNWLAVVGSAIGGILAFCQLTRALQLIKPSLAAALRSFTLVLAFCLQAVISGQLPNYLDLLGASCVVGGVLLLLR